MKPKVLIVDDDRELLESAELLLADLYDLKTASSVEKAKAILLQNEFDVVVVDLNFEGQEEDGIALLDFIGKRVPDVEVIVLSGDKVTARVVEATKRNLVDFVPKSGEYEAALKIAINRGLEKKRVRSEKLSTNNFLTNSPKMKSLLRIVHKIAASHGGFPILIYGETGSGKEVLAKYISGLLGKHMVAANMANIPRQMAESELFGHLKGAFTGAVTNKAGLIEQAHNGVFFLDELGECDLQVQAKLLRAIQEKELQPLGAVKNKRVEVRFFAATNCDLDAMVRAGTFRADLLQRLNTFPLRIPPLRERPEDIVLYTNHFLAEFLGNRPFTVTSCGVAELLAYRWPGNVRELRNIIERMTILTDKRTIDSALVKLALSLAATNDDGRAAVEASNQKRSEILAVLEMENGNRTRAAARMGVHAITLQRWLKRYGITDVFTAQPGRPSVLRQSKTRQEKEAKA
jgi:DNA-binding NtrC family response regulator